MSVLALSKDQLRSKYLKLRKELSRDFAEKRSRLVAQKVLSLQEVANAKIVSAYLAVNNEVETKDIVDGLVSEGKRIFLPKYLGNTPGSSTMSSDESVGFDSPGVRNDSGYSLAEFTGWQNLEKGPFGILQPNTPGVRSRLHLENTPGVSLDIAIIPGVAFDKNGVRLGYGKGVFDKLLAGLRAFKIGLAFDFQIMDGLPQEKHDLVMDLVATEKEVILC